MTDCPSILRSFLARLALWWLCFSSFSSLVSFSLIFSYVRAENIRVTVYSPRQCTYLYCGSNLTYYQWRGVASLGPNSTTRTPAIRTCCTTPPTDPTNGRARNNPTTNLPHRNARAQHLDMSRCWDAENFCPLVVNLLDNKL